MRGSHSTAGKKRRRGDDAEESKRQTAARLAKAAQALKAARPADPKQEAAALGGVAANADVSADASQSKGASGAATSTGGATATATTKDEARSHEKPAVRMVPTPRPRPYHPYFSFFRLVFALGWAGACLLTAIAHYGYVELEAQLPTRFDTLTDFRPMQATQVYSATGELIGEFYLEKRIIVPPEQIPPFVGQAFVAAEDQRFYSHFGVDVEGVIRAAWANYKAGATVEGASTLTMQVARVLLGTHEKTYTWKAKEVLLALKIEHDLTKDQILYLYLNNVYLGHGAYGVEAAAEAYFGKSVDQLTVAEAAMLAGLPKAPTQDSPFINFPRAKIRQEYVLDRMVASGFITQDQADKAQNEPIAIVSRDQPLNDVAAPWFVEMVRRYVEDTYGDSDLLQKGLRIDTTLDMKMQRAAEAAVVQGLESIDRNLGFNGPLGVALEGAPAYCAGPPQLYTSSGESAPQASPDALDNVAYVAAVSSVGQNVTVCVGGRTAEMAPDDDPRLRWWRDRKSGDRLQVGDLVPVRLHSEPRTARHVTTQVSVAQLAQHPSVEGALLSVDPHNGEVKAMVGGYDYRRSQFNRATQAFRQPGSSIKPYIYTSAIDHGYTELTPMTDAPFTVKTASGLWTPKNFGGKYLGPITLRMGLMYSLNTISVQLIVGMGLDWVMGYMRRMGITTPIPRTYSIALGTMDVTLWEQIYGYITFPSEGLAVPPLYITKIQTTDGTIIEQHGPPDPTTLKRRINADTAYVMIDMMKAVALYGTGAATKVLGRPIGCKTGTTQDGRDTWFMGYTTELLTGVWVGRDNHKPLGGDSTGATTALPIWLQYMQNAHPDTPPKDFPVPPGIYFVRANWHNGQPTGPGDPNSALIPFKRGTIPSWFGTDAVLGQSWTAKGF
jgi:penicillin-binding protein 1A